MGQEFNFSLTSEVEAEKRELKNKVLSEVIRSYHSFSLIYLFGLLKSEPLGRFECFLPRWKRLN